MRAKLEPLASQLVKIQQRGFLKGRLITQNIMDIDLAQDAELFFTAIKAVIDRDKPSAAPFRPELTGLENICRICTELFEKRRPRTIIAPDRAATAAS